ncbi:Exodeoxyribonuclease I subunit D [Actinopolyspora xinjiangensis]|uniref:Nuclease SbcCD subunit D n=1 Tax=Actinopolyspora xinjiangensis TaxID=405564 RepID=A0A1H0QQX7_9ACTN|nr:exonuclease SbcCD subunit D [Actinopolyspora xinjiangensis]SDP19743.1 Exodeoxyribonuclease I subunit D [Actinopolyspora xinjiangensis]
MRLLHTSDWHIGRTFHGHDLLDDQRWVLSELAGIVRAEGVDVVLVSGDLYDRSVPSGEAVQTCVDVLEEIRRAGAELVVTPGNHDSPQRIGAFSGFAAAGGLHLHTRISTLHEPTVLSDEHGPVVFYGLPYLEPDPARQVLRSSAAPGAAPGAVERGHPAVLGEAMNRVRAELGARDPLPRSVVLAHAFVTGGGSSDSERDISVGGVDQVPAEVFEGVDYVALGHLHGCQRITERIRYSGSPMAYSFSERRQRKSAWLVELDAEGLAGTRRIELPVPRELATLEGTLEQLLHAPEYEYATDHYVSATVTDEVRPMDGMRRLQQRFPNAVHMVWEPAEGGARAPLRYSEAVRGRDERQLLRDFVSNCRGREPSDSEGELLDRALTEANLAEVRR